MLHRRLQYRHRHCNQQLAHLSAFNRYPKCSLIPFHTPMSKKKETVTINDSQKSLMLICSTARFSICSFPICDTLQQKKTKEKRKEKSHIMYNKNEICMRTSKFRCISYVCRCVVWHCGTHESETQKNRPDSDTN